jgi:hypothetical protein
LLNIGGGNPSSESLSEFSWSIFTFTDAIDFCEGAFFELADS